MDSNLRPLISAAHRLCLFILVPSDVDECHHGNTSLLGHHINKSDNRLADGGPGCPPADVLEISCFFCIFKFYWHQPLDKSFKRCADRDCLLDQRNNVDVFHFRPVGLNILPVLSSSYLECQSSVVYFWTSLWILLEADVLETGSWTLFSSGWSVSLTCSAALLRVLRLCPRSQGAAGQKWNF